MLIEKLKNSLEQLNDKNKQEIIIIHNYFDVYYIEDVES